MTRAPIRPLLPLLAFLGLALAGARCPQSGPVFELGLVSEAWMEARQTDYLTHATEQLSGGSLMNVAAHMERARRDPGFGITPGAMQLADIQGTLDFIHSLSDTSDFRILAILLLLHRYRDDAAVSSMIAPDAWQALEDTVTGFKYWYTDPTPAGVIDDMWYWSENHLIIFHANEYLAGQLYPDRVFPVTGLTGAEHRARARARILEWMALRVRFGFSEWHSNVYWKHSFQPLLMLAELADDPEIAQRAAMLADVMLYDLALHTFQGSYGVTHGRTYKKDKMTALDESTFSIVELLFDQQDDFDYTRRGDLSLQLLASAATYRPPRVLIEVARSQEPMVDRERMGIVFDEHEPIVPDPVHPYGFSYTDPEMLPLWWSMSNLTGWQVVPLTMQTLDDFDLWETEGFQEFGDLSGLRGADLDFLRGAAQALAHAASLALLKEVTTYTYRTADYMMSSAQDYRKGSRSNQAHIWQATFDANAMVMTSHPGEPPRETTDWRSDGQPGQWTGTASIPRVGQHENVAIQIYAPQYAVLAVPPLDSFTNQEPYTHAYFPQDHFDEVVRDGHWTFGRRRDGYIALWSWRLPEYVAYDPAVVATNGMVDPFDLRAPGGSRNVWIAECGSATEWGSFAAFQAAVRDAPVDVVPVDGAALPAGVMGPVFDVTYESPSRGVLELGWEGPLRVDGEPVALTGGARFSNPFSSTPFESPRTGIWDAASGTGLLLDFDNDWRIPVALP